MELLIRSPARIKAYYLLTKPGIIFGNLLTAFGGVAFVSRGQIQGGVLLALLVGLGCIIASGCVSNNYLDRDSDKRMARTKDRALAKGLISLRAAKIFSVALALVGTGILTLFTNPLTVGVALFGLFVYLVLYSKLKYHSVHATLIGSVAGAVPPVAGYCAITPHLDGGALLLFVILVFWQMPHFYAIAIYRMKEYAAASIPVLPLKQGVYKTKIQMLLYTVAFVGVTILPWALNYVGIVYVGIVTPLSLTWLWVCLKGFRAENDFRWARKMFGVSLVVITGFCVALLG